MSSAWSCRLPAAVGGIDLDPEPLQMPGAPLLFALRDPDGISIWIAAAGG